MEINRWIICSYGLFVYLQIVELSEELALVKNMVNE